METLNEWNRDENDWNDDDNSWLMVLSAKWWNEPASYKILKGVRSDINLHQVNKFLHDDLMEWQKFQNGTLTWHEILYLITIKESVAEEE